jgi:hypothetical protein
LLRDEEYSDSLRDWLEDKKPYTGSLLILDEARNAAPASGSRYAIDSKLTRTVRDLSQHFEHRLFLSATPHNGHSNSFSALLEMLDPQRFCRGVPVKSPKLLDDVMVRRLKADLRAAAAGNFPKRHVVQLDITGLTPDAAELRLPVLLDQYRALREETLNSQKATKKQAAAGLLVITSLQKRLLSSIDAFARTLKAHRASATKKFEQEQHEVPQFSLLQEAPGADDEELGELTAEELAEAEAAEVKVATRMSGAFTAASRFQGEEAGRMDPRQLPLEEQRLDRNPGARLHRVRRHPALPPQAARGPAPRRRGAHRCLRRRRCALEEARLSWTSCG